MEPVTKVAWQNAAGVVAGKNNESGILRKLIKTLKEKDSENPNYTWNEYTENSSFHGVKYIFEQRQSLFRRIIWIIMFLLSLIIFVYQCQSRVRAYLKHDTVTDIKINYPKTLVMPAITICNSNNFRLTKLHQYGLINTIAEVYGAEDSFKSIKSEVQINNSLDAIKDLAHQREDLIQQTNWNFKTINATWKTSLSNFGVCYTLVDRLTAMTNDEVLSITLNIEKYEYSAGPHKDIGIKVALHKHDELPMPEGDGLIISPGKHVTIGVEPWYIQTKPPPFGDCSETAVADSNCRLDCRDQAVRRACNCRSPFLPQFLDAGALRDCTFSETLNCARPPRGSMVMRNSSNQCTCRPPCARTDYRIKVSYGSLSSRVSSDNFLNGQTDRDRVEQRRVRALEVSLKNERSNNESIGNIVKIAKLKAKELTEVEKRIRRFLRKESLEDSKQIKQIYYMGTDIVSLILDIEIIINSSLERQKLLEDNCHQNEKLHGPNRKNIEWFLRHRFKDSEKLEACLNSSNAWTHEMTIAIDKGFASLAEINQIREENLQFQTFYLNILSIVTNTGPLSIDLSPCRSKVIDSYDRLDVLLTKFSSAIESLKQAQQCDFGNATTILTIQDSSNEITNELLNPSGVCGVLTLKCWDLEESDLLMEDADDINELKDEMRKERYPSEEMLNLSSIAVVEMATGLDRVLDSWYYDSIDIDGIIENFTDNQGLRAKAWTDFAKAWNIERDHLNRIRKLNEMQFGLPFVYSLHEGERNIHTIFENLGDLKFPVGPKWNELFKPETFRYINRTYPTGHELSNLNASDLKSLEKAMDWLLNSNIKVLEKLIEEMDNCIIGMAESLDNLKEEFSRRRDEIQMDNSFFSENFLMVDLFFPYLKTMVIKQDEAFTIISLFSEVGGFAGLLLGASALTICELLDFIFIKCTPRKKKCNQVTAMK